MGFITDTTPQVIKCYLTQDGRKKLLYSSATHSQIKFFSLHDEDVNYKISSVIDQNLVYNYLKNGFLPDATGDNDICIKSISQAYIVDDNSYLIYGGTSVVIEPIVEPGTEPPVGPEPPTATPRTQPLILEFEYSTNYNNLNDYWIHRRKVDPIDNTTDKLKLGQNCTIILNGDSPTPGATIPLGDQDSRFAIVLKTSPGDTTPITQAERNAVKFNLRLSKSNNITYTFTGTKQNKVVEDFTKISFKDFNPTSPVGNISNYISNYSFASVATNDVVNKLTEMILYIEPSYLNQSNNTRHFEFTFELNSSDSNIQINSLKNTYTYRAQLDKTISN